VILPTRPAMPRHKGKIESGINYGQENALKGRGFASLADQNLLLPEWESAPTCAAGISVRGRIMAPTYISSLLIASQYEHPRSRRVLLRCNPVKI